MFDNILYDEYKGFSASTLTDGLKFKTFTGDYKRDFTVEFSVPLEVDNRIEKI